MAINHLEMIRQGQVNKGNVIGIRKALNNAERASGGYSTSRTAPKLGWDELDAILSALHQHKPRVDAELEASGAKQLRNRRYAKRLAPYAAIIDAPDLHFRLVDFEDFSGGRLAHYTPVYRACSNAGCFDFRNVPWQAGGDGPEIVA